MMSWLTILALSAVPNTPAIRAVRADVQDINSAIKEKRMSTVDATACLVNSEYFELAQVTMDEKKVIRKLAFKGGTSDHLSEAEYYFNAKGKNRFNFVYLGAVNDTRLEVRAYFSSTGQLIHEDRKLLTGEGYPAGLPSAHISDAKLWLKKFCSDAH
jgi:hypothetical protein